jgi:hypothetical protein
LGRLWGNIQTQHPAVAKVTARREEPLLWKSDAAKSLPQR